MDAADALRRLCAVLDAHAWDDLPALLAPDFVCRLAHTGEEFDGPGWVRFNAGYPGFEGMALEDLVGDGDRAAARALVTGTVDGVPARWALAQFATTAEGLITELVEVWTDLDQAPPDDTR